MMYLSHGNLRRNFAAGSGLEPLPNDVCRQTGLPWTSRHHRAVTALLFFVLTLKHRAGQGLQLPQLVEQRR